jgi:flagellar hook protein FlgE
MIRSMFTAINGLFVQQTFMDVVSDNLANVNTPGFKSSFVSFKDQFAQQMKSGAAPSPDGLIGGSNPTQVGLGVNVGAVATRFTQGPLQDTGRDLDLAIQGDGFFVYTDGTAQYYSRDGSLAIDADGYLVNSGTGDRVLGWRADGTGAIDTGNRLEGVSIPIDATLSRITSNTTIVGNLDATEAFPSAGVVHTATLGLYDSLGVLHSVPIQFRRTSALEWSWNVENSGLPGSTGTGSGTLTFDGDTGQLTGFTSAITNADGDAVINVVGSDGSTSPFPVAVDFSDVTMLASRSTATLAAQDGLAAGNLTSFKISANTGEIYGVYSNGLERVFGQLAMALFVNPSGLTRLGNNRYVQGLNSGDARIGAAGTGGRGKVTSGYTEGSNTDMSREFASMILAQRGFQANSRVITTSDEMLQELVNLKR